MTVVNPRPTGGLLWPRSAQGQTVAALPNGGATGDVLTKNSGTDGDASFLPPAGGAGAVPAHVTYNPDTPPSSPTLFSGVNYDQEFVRDAALAGGTIVGAPATSPSIVDRALRIVGGSAGVTPDMKGYEWACPAASFTMTAKLRRRIHTVGYWAFGPYLRVGASGAGQIASYWTVQTPGSATNGTIEYDIYTAPAARTSATNAPGNYPIWWPVYLQMRYDGANVIFAASTTGQLDSFVDFATITRTAAFGAAVAPGRFGIGMDTFGTTPGVGYCEWIRFR